jgi:glycerate 2-kinase
MKRQQRRRSATGAPGGSERNTRATETSALTHNPADPRSLLSHLWSVALRAAEPRLLLPPHLAACLPADPAALPGRLFVIGAGKAAAAMAQAVEAHWHGPLNGIVVTRYGYGLPCQRIEVIEAAHPVPDAASGEAARRIQTLLAGLHAGDTVLALFSGGGSALLAAPRPGLSLAAKREITARLLKSGATIHEINCVRKHLSWLKGGQLAALAAPARLVTLALSDVAGDDATVIASGPTVADPTTCADALAVLERYAVDVPPAVRGELASGAWETPKPGDPRLAGGEFRLIGSGQAVLQAAARAAATLGVAPLVLGDAIEGEAREVARVMAGIARSCQRHGSPVAPPCVILSGGETTVTVRGGGRGGRNSEFLLALGLALRGTSGISALAADTDGIDGSADNAGAIYTPQLWTDAVARGLGAPDWQSALDGNDAYTLFAQLGALVVSGPTHTNVNDFRAIYVAPSAVG